MQTPQVVLVFGRKKCKTFHYQAMNFFSFPKPQHLDTCLNLNVQSRSQCQTGLFSVVSGVSRQEGVQARARVCVCVCVCIRARVSALRAKFSQLAASEGPDARNPAKRGHSEKMLLCCTERQSAAQQTVNKPELCLFFVSTWIHRCPGKSTRRNKWVYQTTKMDPKD